MPLKKRAHIVRNRQSAKTDHRVKIRTVVLNLRMDATNWMMVVLESDLPGMGAIRHFTTKNTVKKRWLIARFRK